MPAPNDASGVSAHTAPPTPEELARATAQALRAAGTLSSARRAAVGRLLDTCLAVLRAMGPATEDKE